MATSLKALQDTTATTTVDVFGQVFEVEYRPNYITGAVDTQFRQTVNRATAAAVELDSLPPGPERDRAEQEAAQAEQAMYQLVADVVVRWDIYLDEDEQDRLGTSVEDMQQLPASLVTRVFQQVRDELAGKGRSGRRSGAGSSQAGRGSRQTQNGTTPRTG